MNSNHHHHHLRLLLALGLLALGAQLAGAALDFDLNEPPPPDDDDDELAEPNEPNGPRPMEGLEPHDEQSQASPMEVDSSAGQTGGLASLWGSFKQRLPEYFDFGKFAAKFKRSYKAAEWHLRRSIFAAKCVEIFKSRVAFRLGRSSYLAGVNKFADQSREEFRMMFMPGPPPEFLAGPPAGSGGSGAPGESRKEFEARLVERKRELEAQEEANSHLMMEVDTQGSGEDDHDELVRREIDEFYRREGALAFSQEQERAIERALREELAELGMETLTQGGGGSAGHELPWPGQLSSSQVMETSQQDEQYRPPPVEALGDPDAPPLDWSRHECFHEVYDQGKACGKCYVMASTALAEFYKCSEGGPGRGPSRRKFSKEFVLDCAQKFTPTVMGCAGGSPLDTLRFIAHAGICNIRDWRQRRQTHLRETRQAGERLLDELDLRCPLNPMRTPIEQWGNIRIKLNPKRVGPNDWLAALQDGPLVASVQMPSEGVDTYAGGVHDGRGCATSGQWHAMLLVGYGLSDRGEPYWRFRNSFGPDWGDGGHFNLAMNVPPACIAGGVRVFREPPDS